MSADDLLRVAAVSEMARGASMGDAVRKVLAAAVAKQADTGIPPDPASARAFQSVVSHRWNSTTSTTPSAPPPTCRR